MPVQEPSSDDAILLYYWTADETAPVIKHVGFSKTTTECGHSSRDTVKSNAPEMQDVGDIPDIRHILSSRLYHLPPGVVFLKVYCTEVVSRQIRPAVGGQRSLNHRL